MDIDDEREILSPLESVVTPAKEKKRKSKKVKKMALVESPGLIMGSGGDNSGAMGLGAGLGGGLLGGILASALFGNRNGGLFGGGEGGGAGVATLQSSIDTNTILGQLSAIQAAVPLAESQVQLALAGLGGSLSAQGLNQTIALQNQGFQSQLANVAGFNSVGDKVDNLAAANALAIATNQFNCVTATQVDGEKTRALIVAQNDATLNRIITVQAAELAELRNEGSRASDRHGIEINMINNQNQNQMQFQQQAQILNGVIHALSDVTQVARATNQAINIGGGTQVASPTNSATNVKA